VRGGKWSNTRPRHKCSPVVRISEEFAGALRGAENGVTLTSKGRRPYGSSILTESEIIDARLRSFYCYQSSTESSVPVLAIPLVPDPFIRTPEADSAVSRPSDQACGTDFKDAPPVA
jgi:hypothetical protein